MFHAMLYHVITCFICILYSFYAFSATNLLTRCRSASSLFFAVFGFTKALKKISAKLETSQPRFIFGIFASRKTKDKTKRGRKATLSPGGAAPLPAAPGGEEVPSGAHRPRSFVHINPPDLKTEYG